MTDAVRHLNRPGVQRLAQIATHAADQPPMPRADVLAILANLRDMPRQNKMVRIGDLFSTKRDD